MKVKVKSLKVLSSEDRDRKPLQPFCVGTYSLYFRVCLWVCVYDQSVNNALVGHILLHAKRSKRYCPFVCNSWQNQT